MRRAGIVAAAALLSACSTVPLTSLPKLMALDIETIDPATLELAVLHSDTVGIRPGTAVIFAVLTDERSGQSIQTRQVIDTPETVLPPELRRRLQPGVAVSRFSVSETASASLRDFRERARVMRERSGAKPKGSFSASVGFCAPDAGAPVPDEIAFTIFIRTKPEQRFYKLFKTQEVEFEGAADMTGGMTPCPAVDSSDDSAANGGVGPL